VLRRPKSRFESSPGHQSRFAVGLAGAGFGRDGRFHFHHSETRNHTLRAGVEKNALDEIAARLATVVPCQSARIEDRIPVCHRLLSSKAPVFHVRHRGPS
jgi:hypothetical protein